MKQETDNCIWGFKMSVFDREHLRQMTKKELNHLLRQEMKKKEWKEEDNDDGFRERRSVWVRSIEEFCRDVNDEVVDPNIYWLIFPHQYPNNSI